MENWIKKAGELLIGLALTQKEDPSVIPYQPQKTEISKPEKAYFKRERPEKLGVSSLRIYKMLAELEAEERANVHSIIVVKDGAVISEASIPGYDVNTRQLSHSMTKSVIGMAIGLVVDMGLLRLDEKLVDIFPEFKSEDKFFREITVKHLLTMTTGVKISEAGSVTESEWTKAFFDSKLSEAPGARFKYNSMNSYMLAKIVEKRTGEGIMQFLKPRLFAPLHIDNVFWEKGPEGLEKGGWGLYLSPESWAKLGTLMLQGGVFENRRILSREWVRESTETHSVTSESLGDFNYGYQVWVAREGTDFLFNGMLGQNTWICPKNKLVVAVSSGNNEFFQQSPALSIIRKYLGADSLATPFERGGVSLLREKEARFFESRRAVVPLARRRGLKYFLGLANSAPYDERFNSLLGEYAFASNNQGILPAFVRVMQNNYSGGIKEMKISRLDDRLEIISREGKGEYRFIAGLYDFASSIVDFNGEKYILSALAAATEDDRGRTKFKLLLTFPELPNTRIIEFVSCYGGFYVKMLETPNQKLAIPFLEGFKDGSKKLGFAVDFIEKRLGEGFIEGKISELFEPTVVAVNKAGEDFQARLDEENLAVEEKMRPAKVLSEFVSKFLKTDGEEDGEAEAPRRSIVSDMFGFFIGRKRFEDDGED